MPIRKPPGMRATEAWVGPTVPSSSAWPSGRLTVIAGVGPSGPNVARSASMVGSIADTVAGCSTQAGSNPTVMPGVVVVGPAVIGGATVSGTVVGASVADGAVVSGAAVVGAPVGATVV